MCVRLHSMRDPMKMASWGISSSDEIDNGQDKLPAPIYYQSWERPTCSETKSQIRPFAKKRAIAKWFLVPINLGRLNVKYTLTELIGFHL